LLMAHAFSNRQSSWIVCSLTAAMKKKHNTRALRCAHRNLQQQNAESKQKNKKTWSKSLLSVLWENWVSCMYIAPVWWQHLVHVQLWSSCMVGKKAFNLRYAINMKSVLKTVLPQQTAISVGEQSFNYYVYGCARGQREEHARQGCQMFLVTIYQKRELNVPNDHKFTKWRYHIPNGHKIF
jgi:hypothetical protein